MIEESDETRMETFFKSGGVERVISGASIETQRLMHFVSFLGLIQTFGLRLVFTTALVDLSAEHTLLLPLCLQSSAPRARSAAPLQPGC